MLMRQHCCAAARRRWRRPGARGASGRLAELDAEDRLAVACERAPTTDPVIAKLRAAFQVRAYLAAVVLRMHLLAAT